MKRKYGFLHIQKYIFKIQCIVFIGLLLAIGTSLYEKKPIENLAHQLLIRGPASISESQTSKSTEIIKIPCDTNSKFSAQSHHVRLESDFCEKNFESLKIKNSTTGTQSVFFKRSPASFTTEYIQLEPGENEISFIYKNGKNEIQKTVQILKTTP